MFHIKILPQHASVQCFRSRHAWRIYLRQGLYVRQSERDRESRKKRCWKYEVFCILKVCRRNLKNLRLMHSSAHLSLLVQKTFFAEITCYCAELSFRFYTFCIFISIGFLGEMRSLGPHELAWTKPDNLLGLVWIELIRVSVNPRFESKLVVDSKDRGNWSFPRSHVVVDSKQKPFHW